MKFVLSTSIFPLSKLGWLAIVFVVALVGFAAASGIILLPVPEDLPAGWAMQGGEKADLLDAGYGPYYSGSTERDAPSAVSVLVPRQDVGGNSILETGHQIT